MSKLKLDRRTVIKGAGSIAIALPWLEIMGHRPARQRADATPVPLKRFLSRVQPGGTVRSGTLGDKYRRPAARRRSRCRRSWRRSSRSRASCSSSTGST